VGHCGAEILNLFICNKFSSVAQEGLETTLFQNGCLAFRSPASSDLCLRDSSQSSQSQKYVTTDGLSTSLSWCQPPEQDFCYCQIVVDLLMWVALSDERTGLSFTIAACPRQRSHTRVLVPRDSGPYFTVSDSRFPQPGGLGPRVHIPQEQGGPVIPPVIWFHFRRLLRLAGLRWSYSNPPSQGARSLVSEETHTKGAQMWTPQKEINAERRDSFGFKQTYFSVAWKYIDFRSSAVRRFQNVNNCLRMAK
jgi:hypothetical protein